MDAPSTLQTLLIGLFGGILGGVITFILTDIGIRKPREQFGIAEALAAELLNAASDLQTFLDDEDPNEIPAYFRTSHVVLDALASRLAELRYEDVVSVVRVYRLLDELNLMPNAWRERALNALSGPSADPHRSSELAALEDGRKGFYKLVAGVHTDCRGLATHLRTEYTLGFLALVPLRLRPSKRIDL